jgi:hypothetical protein
MNGHRSPISLDAPDSYDGGPSPEEGAGMEGGPRHRRPNTRVVESPLGDSRLRDGPPVENPLLVSPLVDIPPVDSPHADAWPELGPDPVSRITGMRRRIGYSIVALLAAVVVAAWFSPGTFGLTGYVRNANLRGDALYFASPSDLPQTYTAGVALRFRFTVENDSNAASMLTWKVTSTAPSGAIILVDHGTFSVVAHGQQSQDVTTTPTGTGRLRIDVVLSTKQAVHFFVTSK